MTKVIFVGEMYYSDLSVGGGPMPGGGSPSHPWVPPGAGAPSHPIYIPGLGPAHPIVIPGVPDGQPGSPSHPIYIPGSPSHPIAGQPPYPDQGLPPGSAGVPTHPWVPPSGETLPPPPADIADKYIVAMWNPTTDVWTVRVGDATPTPHA